MQQRKQQQRKMSRCRTRVRQVRLLARPRPLLVHTNPAPRRATPILLHVLPCRARCALRADTLAFVVYPSGRPPLQIKAPPRALERRRWACRCAPCTFDGFDPRCDPIDHLTSLQHPPCLGIWESSYDECGVWNEQMWHAATVRALGGSVPVDVFDEDDDPEDDDLVDGAEWDAMEEDTVRES